MDEGGSLDLGSLRLNVVLDSSAAAAGFTTLTKQSQDLGSAFGNTGKASSDLGGVLQKAVADVAALKQAQAALYAAQADGIRASANQRDAALANVQAMQQLRMASLAAKDETGALSVALLASNAAYDQVRAAVQALATAEEYLKRVQATGNEQAIATARLEAAKATTTYRDSLVELATVNGRVQQSAQETTNRIKEQSAAHDTAAKSVQAHTAAHGPLQTALGGTSQAVQVLTMNMGGLGQGIQQATMAASGFSGPLIAVAVAVAGVGLALGASIKAATDFQTTIVTTANNTQMTTAEMNQMAEGVKQLALIIPVTTKSLAEGWRYAADEGFNAADSFKVVAAGAQAAANTGANTTEVINTLAKALHDFHLPANEAMLVTNMLIEGAKQGQTTFQAMSESIGPLIAQAASLHVPLTDIVAAMSALTQNGYPAGQAVTGLTNLLKEMIAPSDKAKAAMAAMGPEGQKLVAAFTPAGLAANGLSGNIKLLTEATHGNAGAILEILPQLRGYRSGLVLAGSGADDFTTALSRQADVLSGKLKPTQDDFARTMETVGAKMQILKNTVQVLAIDLGTVFLPILIQVVQKIIDFAQAIGLLSGASGFANVKQQIADVNKTFLDGKAAQDAYAAAMAANQAGATNDAAKTAQSVEAATEKINQQKDAIALAKTAVDTLNTALAMPNAASGADAAKASLAGLEQSASGDVGRAIHDLNTLLQLPDGTIGPKNAATALGEMKDAALAVGDVVHNLDVQLAGVKQQLDGVRDAQAAIHDQYDPIMKTAQDAITANDRPNYTRLAQEANLQATHVQLQIDKPDVSQYTSQIEAAQDAIKKIQGDATNRNSGVGGYGDQVADIRKQLDDLGSFDASGWDDKIKEIQGKAVAAAQGYADAIKGLRADEAATAHGHGVDGIKTHIDEIAESVAGLNTDTFDAKIADLRDKLSQPAPDTHGITNQLKELEAQLASKAISQSEFDTRYGALSRQKQGINQGYLDTQTSGKSELKQTEEQRADAALANREKKHAAEEEMRNLRESLKIAEAKNLSDRDGIVAKINGFEREKTLAERNAKIEEERVKKDRDQAAAAHKQKVDGINDEIKVITTEQARKDRQDKLDIATQNAKAEAAKTLADNLMAPWKLQDDANKKATDALHLLDDQDKAARDIANLPLRKTYDDAKAAMDAALIPLAAQQHGLDEQNRTLTEQRTYWQGIKSDIDSAKSSVDALVAANKVTPGGSHTPVMGGGPNGDGTINIGWGPKGGGSDGAIPNPDVGPNAGDMSGGGTIPELPMLTQFKELKTWLDTNIPTIAGQIKLEAKLDFAAVTNGIEFVKAAAQLVTDLYEHNWGALKGDIAALGGTIGGKSGGTAINETQGAFGSGTADTQPGLTPASQEAIQLVGQPATEAVNSAQSFFGDVGNFFTGASDTLSGALNWLGGSTGGGGNHVSAADLGGQIGEIDQFSQHIQDQLGDSGNAQAAIAAFKDQITREIGQGSDAATAVRDAEATFANTFGAGNAVPTALIDTGKAAQRTLGTGGDVATAFAQNDQGVMDTTRTLDTAAGSWDTAYQTTSNSAAKNLGTIDQSVITTAANATTQFGANGPADAAAKNLSASMNTSQTNVDGSLAILDNAVATTATGVGKNLGANGTADTHLTTFGNSVSTASSGAVGDFGMIDAAVIATGGPAGTIITNLNVAKAWLGKDWQTASGDISKPFTDAWPAIDGFFKSLSTGLSWLATNFKLPFTVYTGANTGFIGPPAPPGTTGGTVPTGSHATGLNFPGSPGAMGPHYAVIGENGPETMFVPGGSSILPNHVSQALGLLPGHADGLNMDALLAGMGGSLAHNGDKLIDSMMGALGTATIPGIEGAGAAMGAQITTGLHEWMKGSLVNNPPAAARARSGSRGGMSGGDAFSDMAFSDYMAVVSQYPGWWDNQGAFDALMQVSRETNVNPRWPMAIAEQEIGFGTSNPNLASIFNFWGMGYHESPWTHRSGSAATDIGPSDYAAYSSFHDSIEDIDAYINRNGTSWGNGYSSDPGAAGAKRAIFDQIVAATPAPGGSSFIGPTQATGGVGTIEGMPGNQLLDIARGVSGRLYWCEQYIGDAMQAAGLRYARAGSAEEHAHMQDLTPGLGPLGAIDFFPWTDNAGNAFGHVAFSLGDGSTVFGTRAGTPNDPSQVGSLNVSGWEPYGYTVNPAADGAYVTGGPALLWTNEGRQSQGEITAPIPMLERVVRENSGGTTTVNMSPGTVVIHVGPRDDPYTAGRQAGNGFVDSLREHGRVP